MYQLTISQTGAFLKDFFKGNFDKIFTLNENLAQSPHIKGDLTSLSSLDQKELGNKSLVIYMKVNNIFQHISQN